jgi:type II secretion system protein N
MSNGFNKVLAFLRNAQESATRAYGNLNARPSAKTKVLRWSVFLGAFSLGCLLFFPTSTLENRLATTLSQATRADVSLSQLSVGTGLGAGLLRGGLIGLHVKMLKVSARGVYWECPEAMISPRLLPIFMGKLSVSFVCDRGDAGEISGQIGASPVWAPAKADLDVDLDDVKLSSLASVMPGISGMQGLLSGEVHMREYDLSTGRSGEVTWDLEAAELQTPPVASDLVSLPPLLIGPLASSGSLKGPRLEIASLDFGENKGLLQGKLKAQMGVNRQMLPTSGTLSGSLKIDPAFEAQQQASAISTKQLDFLFGPIKPSGSREFKKRVEGGPLSLYAPPEG